MFEKYCYKFGEGGESLKDLLGDKGARLCALTTAGLPVPDGFIITAEALSELSINDAVRREVLINIGHLRLSYKGYPLQVSVRASKHKAAEAELNVNADDNDGLFKAIARVYAKRGCPVIVQNMVFGNADANSGTGIVFLTHPGTKEKCFFGEFLDNAQGHDVIAAPRLPLMINPQMRNDGRFKAAYEELEKACEKISKNFPETCEVGFTVEKGKLFILGARDL